MSTFCSIIYTIYFCLKKEFDIFIEKPISPEQPCHPLSNLCSSFYGLKEEVSNSSPDKDGATKKKPCLFDTKYRLHL